MNILAEKISGDQRGGEMQKKDGSRQ